MTPITIPDVINAGTYHGLDNLIHGATVTYDSVDDTTRSCITVDLEYNRVVSTVYMDDCSEPHDIRLPYNGASSMQRMVGLALIMSQAYILATEEKSYADPQGHDDFPTPYHPITTEQHNHPWDHRISKIDDDFNQPSYVGPFNKPWLNVNNITVPDNYIDLVWLTVPHDMPLSLCPELIAFITGIPTELIQHPEYSIHCDITGIHESGAVRFNVHYQRCRSPIRARMNHGYTVTLCADRVQQLLAIKYEI